MAYQRGLAAQAMIENIQRIPALQEQEKHNLFLAIHQVALGLDQMMDEQRATKRLLEQLAGHLLR